MAKPKLLYVAFFTDKPTRPEEYLHSKIIGPLKQRGMFKEDSEILEVHRTPFANSVQIYASISPAYGGIGGVQVYSRCCRPEDFHKRNRQQYIDFLASGGDIFPIYIEDKMERVRVSNFVRWKAGTPKEPLGPEHNYTNGRDWDNAIEKLKSL